MSSDLQQRLSAPFDNVQWRLQQTHPKGATKPYPAGTRGMFLAYIDARQLYDRLDEVLGIGNWQRSVKQVNADGSVVVAISIRFGDEWITHEDVGYSNNPGESHEKEPIKAAVSDGAKRAAVGFGVGRFLYDMGERWVEIDQWGKPLGDLSTGELPAQATTVRQNGNGQHAPQARPGLQPTPRQFGMIRAVAQSIGMSDDELHQFAGVASLNDLDRAQASQLIDRLQALESDPDTETYDTTDSGVPRGGGPRDGSIVDWTAFWSQARAAGYSNKAAVEQAIGALGPDPQAALTRLMAQQHTRQPSLA